MVKRVRSQQSQHQLSQSQRQTTIHEAFTAGSSSQQNGDDRPITDFNEMVNNCVRYVVCRMGQTNCLKRNDIQTNVSPFGNVGRQLDDVIKAATKILKEIYGLNLLQCETGKSATKMYIISTAVPYDALISVANDGGPVDEENATDFGKILMTLILAHILMSNGSTTEGSLFQFLRAVQIDPDHRRHDYFDDVRAFISNTMMKQHYLITDVESGTKKTLYKWGPRAEKEISKMAMLHFVRETYKDRPIEAWPNQAEAAKNQAFENTFVCLDDDNAAAMPVEAVE